MRLARAGRYALLILPLGLAACSWLPWHKKHAAVDGAVPAMAASSVSSPAAALPPAPAVSMPAAPTSTPANAEVTLASVADPASDSTAAPSPNEVAARIAPIAPSRINATSRGQYAPLSESEWRDLFGKYQQLAQCEDRYMNSAGLNSEDVAQRLVLMNTAGALRADALRLLAADSPLRAQWTAATAVQASQQAVLINQTLTVLMGDDGTQASLGRTLARKAVARFYVSLITGPVCRVDPTYQVLMRKAAS